MSENKTWIQSSTNQKIDPRYLDLDCSTEVALEEMAHALASKCRFTGQAKMQGSNVYTVAQHCVLGSLYISPFLALPFLLHEMSEVYLADIAQPIKPFLRVIMDGHDLSWVELEDLHAIEVLTALGLNGLHTLLYHPEVKEMDLAMLVMEKRDLMGPEPEPWASVVGVNPASDDLITIWPHDEAKRRFLERFKQLTTRP